MYIPDSIIIRLIKQEICTVGLLFINTSATPLTQLSNLPLTRNSWAKSSFKEADILLTVL